MKVLILLYLFLPLTFAIQYIVTDSSLENLTISKAELKALANDLARVNSNSASRAVGKRAQIPTIKCNIAYGLALGKITGKVGARIESRPG
ncbi:hypothetical protein POX_b02017 [Penicillium oxalicum]|uniref:hypothetical protein n=1 Tax=Penicillium oxalicum TaxID=69781 RepID=UPI0020B6AB85|nr:hypothetical protein POX_b02017 [Penicillium oxalicum]KAI2791987.1 hypothetical protein POX_b02017 [Penicillium oxalicum]